MVISLRSKRLALLFDQVWKQIPRRDQKYIAKHANLIVDNPIFFPKGEKPIWGAVICVRFKKDFLIVYFAPRRLPKQSDSLVRYVMAHELAHVRKRHTEQLFSSSGADTETRFEKEARLLARRWGFTKPKRQLLHNGAKRNKIAVGKERRKK